MFGPPRREENIQNLLYFCECIEYAKKVGAIINISVIFYIQEETLCSLMGLAG